jgi:putative endonuclease
MNWCVYIILCSDDSLYTGITTDMERRFRQHAEGRGAKYFRGRSPKQTVYLEQGLSRSSAASREARIKAMPRVEKLNLIQTTGLSGQEPRCA